jgi:hypothetical protein
LRLLCAHAFAAMLHYKFDISFVYNNGLSSIYERQTWRAIYEVSLRPVLLKNLIPDKRTLPNEASRKPGRPRHNRYRKDNVKTRIRKDAKRQDSTTASRSTRTQILPSKSTAKRRRTVDVTISISSEYSSSSESDEAVYEVTDEETTAAKDAEFDAILARRAEKEAVEEARITKAKADRQAENALLFPDGNETYFDGWDEAKCEADVTAVMASNSALNSAQGNELSSYNQRMIGSRRAANNEAPSQATLPLRKRARREPMNCTSCQRAGHTTAKCPLEPCAACHCLVCDCPDWERQGRRPQDV